MKKINKFFLRIFKLVTISIISLLIAVILTCMINNKIQLQRESKILSPMGKLVKINNTKFHVYTEGNGPFTCVFMPGLGNVAPEIEMKPLYKNISDEYRIAIIDRAGYGFSDEYKGSRNIDTILEQTRIALKLAGEKPPYILFPHSISGLEAIYWAQKYPKEVKAIIGLDIGFPEAYVKEDIKKSDLTLIKTQAIISKLGIHRLFPSLSLEQMVLNTNLLSESDKEIYKALTYKNLLSKNVVQELSSLTQNSSKSLNLKLPTKTPICIFLATPLTKEEKNLKSDFILKRFNYYNTFISQFEKGKLIPTPAKHSIYLYCPENIAKKSKAFIKENIN